MVDANLSRFLPFWKRLVAAPLKPLLLRSPAKERVTPRETLPPAALPGEWLPRSRAPALAPCRPKGLDPAFGNNA